MCPEAGHRQDLICYVRLESELIRREERGCLIKFTFHFLTWHQSPVTHGTDGDAANNFFQNLVGGTDWEMRRQKGERETSTVWLVSILWFQDGNKSMVSGGSESRHPPPWKERAPVEYPERHQDWRHPDAHSIIYGSSEGFKLLVDWNWFMSTEKEIRRHPRDWSKDKTEDSAPL